MSDTHDQPTRRSARFSLLTLVWLITIAALAVGLYSSKRRNDRLAMRNEELVARTEILTVENREYRSRLGIFDIEDPKKIHAIRAPSEDGEPRKYRIYLPPGRKYVASYQANRIPEQGVGEFPNPMVMEPGTYVMKVKINRQHDRESGDPIPTVVVDFDVDPVKKSRGTRFSAKVAIDEMWNDWIVNKQTGHMSYRFSELDDTLELHDPQKPLVVFRARAEAVKVHKRNSEGRVTSHSTEDIEGKTDGFMVWIAPQEEEGEGE